MDINVYIKYILIFMTKLGHYPVVLGLFKLRCNNVNISFPQNSIVFDCNFYITHCTSKVVGKQEISILPLEKISNAMITGSTFICTLHKSKGELTTYTAIVYEIHCALCPTLKEPVTEDEKIKDLIPTDYHEYLPLFKKAVAAILPFNYPYDNKIPLKEAFTPLFSVLFLVSKTKLLAFR